MENPYQTDPTAAAGDPPAAATTLTSRGSRRLKFIVLALVATVWTGFSGTMWVLAFQDGETFAVAFLSLFVLVGLGIFIAAGHQFLAMFNPQVRLTLPAEPLTLGGPLTIEWELTGRVARLAGFALQLVGTEQASYRQGTDRRTDRHVFRTLDLLTLDDPDRIMDGRGRIAAVIPSDTMHSWEGQSNQVRWTLRARGTIRRWPDVNDEWTVQIHPMPARAAAAPVAAYLEEDAAEESRFT